MEQAWRIAVEFGGGVWGTLMQMAPYLLLGFLAAGVLSVLVKPETVERHLGGRGLMPVVKAALFGVPMPLCSCGVIPFAASLRRHGASRGATLSFLLSTPQTGLDNALLMYGMLGPVFAIFSPVTAFITGLVGGAATEMADAAEEGRDATPAKCQDACCAMRGTRSAAARALHFGFRTLPRDVAKPLLIGLLIAGALAALVPKEFFSGALGRGFTGILVMMLLGIPVYVCATASIPIAAALVLKGAAPGAALAFLITGPATNAATIATIWKILGRRTALIYVATIAAAAMGFGLLLNGIFEVIGTGSIPRLLSGEPAAESAGIIGIVSAAALLGVLAYSFREYAPPEEKPLVGEEYMMETRKLKVTGMTCGHCVEHVRKALLSVPGIEAAEVDLKAGIATVTGMGLDVAALRQAIEKAGYMAEE